MYLWSLFSGELSVKRVNFKKIRILEQQPILPWRFQSGPSLLIQIVSFFMGRVWDGLVGCRGLYVDFTTAALAQSLEREVVASRRGKGGEGS